jgi:hypothetical protein
VYGQDIRVVVVPSILAFAYLGPLFYLDSLAYLDLLPLVMWMASIGGVGIAQNFVYENLWASRLVLTSILTSLTVNALVTSLIVFKILQAFRRVKSVTTSEEKSLGIAGGTKLRSLIFVIIESGMVLFAIQLARAVITAFESVAVTSAAYYAFQFVLVIHEMVNVIISVIVTVCLLITSI